MISRSAGHAGRYGARHYGHGSRSAWRRAATATAYGVAGGYGYAGYGDSGDVNGYSYSTDSDDDSGGCALQRRTVRRNGWYRTVWVRVCD